MAYPDRSEYYTIGSCYKCGADFIFSSDDEYGEFVEREPGCMCALSPEQEEMALQEANRQIKPEFREIINKTAAHLRTRRAYR